MWDGLIRDAITLFVVIDPVGTVPIFVSLTRFSPVAERRAVAFRAIGISTIVLMLFLLGGQFLLNALHIRLTSFQVAGGIVLFLFGLQMVNATEPKGEPEQSTQSADIAVYPLAVPFIAGPGSMLAVIVLADKARFSVLEQTRTAVVLLLVLGLTLFALLSADWIQRRIGGTGSNVVSRVMGLILCALAAETVLSGLESVFVRPAAHQPAAVVQRTSSGNEVLLAVGNTGANRLRPYEAVSGVIAKPRKAVTVPLSLGVMKFASPQMASQLFSGTNMSAPNRNGVCVAGDQELPRTNRPCESANPPQTRVTALFSQRCFQKNAI